MEGFDLSLTFPRGWSKCIYFTLKTMLQEAKSICYEHHLIGLSV